MTLTVEVQLAPPFIGHVDTKQVQEVVREVLVQERKLEGTTSAAELTVVITDDERVRELNDRYRGVNSPTDVLAFGGAAERFVEAPGAIPYLGDVVISYPRVRAQAEKQGHSPDRELALLAIHGVLHLLGYNHATPEGEAIMWARQEAILRQVD